MKYLYFPGCSCSSDKTTAAAYKESLDAIWKALDVQTEEIEDWNCCGATTYMSVDEFKAFGLASRNLALADEQLKRGGYVDNTIVTPCSACYMVLNKTQHYVEEYPEVRDIVTGALHEVGLSYREGIIVRHPLDIVCTDVGLETLAAKVKKPLTGLKVACYYGCLLVRPYSHLDNPHDPGAMERFTRALGAEPVEWSLKTRCCGGSLMGTLEDVGKGLNRILLKQAKERGADVIITVCPFCQFNLECFQDMISDAYDEDLHMPIVFFSQLAGLALGIPEKKLGMQRLFESFNVEVIRKAKGGSHVHQR